MYATSGAVPAARAVVTFGRRSPLDVPPEFSCTTIFGCEALNLFTSRCMTCSSIPDCAVQNWIVTFPELFPEELPELDEHPATTTVNAAIPASAVRFILALLVRQPMAAVGSSLHGPGDRLDEAALTGKEHKQHRRRRQGGTGHDSRPLGHVLALERSQAYLHGKGMARRDRDQRPEEIVPRVDERDDSKGGHGRPCERQHDLPENLEPAAAVNAPGLLEFPRERLKERVHEVDAERGCQLRHDEGPERIDEPEVVEYQERRDHRELERNESGREQQDQHHA